MRISVATKFKLKNDHGFTLMEVMIALLLISIIFISIPSTNPITLRAKLEETIDNLDRAVRFAQNESILRNAITRIRINFAEEPVKFAVEYSTKANLTLPTPNVEENKLSIKEREELAKQQNKINSQFSKVDEFMDKEQEVPEDVAILGIGTSAREKLIDEGTAAIYFYPTGEKDAAVIFITTEEEIAALKIPAFRDDTKVDYKIFSEQELENLEDSQENSMDEMFEEWLKSSD
jgi:prepilin-type N-terminal cleavage/methylation domain-containing protein